ncbi:MAG: YbgA family protein, partial [Anaerolineales bacterium]
SCGLFRVKVYNDKNVPERTGRGIFAAELTKAYPLLPLEEEGRLHDMRLRENFFQRVFTYRRWMEMLIENPTPSGLIEFHSAHKLTLMAHSPRHYKELGQLTAQAGKLTWDELTANYGQLLMERLSTSASRGKHANVLQHLMGFLKDHLSVDEKSELLGIIEDYRTELLPLIVPLTLIKHHFRRHPVPDWVHQQIYLEPHPKELALLNHV